MTIYERIKKLGENKNMNIAEIERGSGFNSSTIKNWKKGHPSVESLFAVSDFLKVDPRYIFNGEFKSYDLPPEQQELLNTYEKLTPEQQESIKFIMSEYTKVQ